MKWWKLTEILELELQKYPDDNLVFSGIMNKRKLYHHWVIWCIIVLMVFFVFSKSYSAEAVKTVSELKGASSLSSSQESSRVDKGLEGWDEDPYRGKPRINIPWIIVSLLIVSGLAYGILKVYGYVTGGGGTSFSKRVMRVRERYVISPNKYLLLVELPGKVVVVGVSDNDMKVLTELDSEKVKDLLEVPEEGEKTINPSSYLWNVIFRRQNF